MKVNIEIKIKMDNGKDVILNHDEAKELLSKLKDIFPEPIYIPSMPTIIQEPYRWREKAWYSNTGNVTISNKTE